MSLLTECGIPGMLCKAGEEQEWESPLSLFGCPVTQGPCPLATACTLVPKASPAKDIPGGRQVTSTGNSSKGFSTSDTCLYTVWQDTGWWQVPQVTPAGKSRDLLRAGIQR